MVFLVTFPDLYIFAKRPAWEMDDVFMLAVILVLIVRVAEEDDNDDLSESSRKLVADCCGEAESDRSLLADEDWTLRCCMPMMLPLPVIVDIGDETGDVLH